MKKTLFLAFILLAAIIASLNSCKQCNSNKVTETVDTIISEPVRKMNEAIKNDSLNPFLYFKRAKVFENENDIKSALTDMYIAISLDSLQPDFYLYSAELFIKANEPKRAIMLMAQAISTDSNYVGYYIQGGRYAYLIKDYEEFKSNEDFSSL